MSGETLHPSFALHCRGDFYRDAYLSFTYFNYTIIYFYLNFFFIVGRFQSKGGDARRKYDNRVFRSRIIYYNTVHWISLRWRIDTSTVH
jgi:hypothetical protein